MGIWGRDGEFATVEKQLEGRTGMTFLEFGCVRDANSVRGDGHSTVFLTHLAKRTNSKLVSCDISEDAISCAKKVLEGHGLYPSSAVSFIHGNALDVARKWEGTVDFVLLDGCALWPTNDAKAFEKAHKDVFEAVERHLREGAIVMVDDIGVRGGAVIPYMESKGWKNLFQGHDGAVFGKQS